MHPAQRPAFVYADTGVAAVLSDDPKKQPPHGFVFHPLEKQPSCRALNLRVNDFAASGLGLRHLRNIVPVRASKRNRGGLR